MSVGVPRLTSPAETVQSFTGDLHCRRSSRVCDVLHRRTMHVSVAARARCISTGQRVVP
jgi:hypothetical protein